MSEILFIIKICFCVILDRSHLVIKKQNPDNKANLALVLSILSFC